MIGRGFLNRFWLLGIVVIFLISGGSLAANGVQENRLAKAKELIAEKNYNDAILLLTTMVREEPDRQDEAQELISEIVRLRNQYNNDYESLINLLYDQKDEATALKVIAELENLDKNPNKQTQDEIAQAKRTARLIANNKRYRDIMARGLAFLNRGEYGAAIQVYLEGSDLAKDMFQEAGYGNVVSNQVDRSWEDLKATSGLFTAAETRLKALQNQGVAVLASASSDPAPLEAMLATMRDVAAWRQRVWNDGRLFKLQNSFLVKNSRQEDFFLGYSTLFVQGPPEEKAPEGILGAFDRLWAQVLNPWMAQIRTGVETKYTQAKAALDGGRYNDAATAFESLRIQARQGMDVVVLWNRLAGIDEDGAFDPQVRSRLAPILPLGVWLDHRLALALEGLQASSELPKTTTLIAAADLDRPTLESARLQAHALKTSFDTFAQATAAWTQQSRALANSGFTLVDGPSFGTDWNAIWSGFRLRAQGQEAEFVDRRGAFDYRVLDGRFQALQTTLGESRDQVEGRVKYPLQATARLQDLRPLQDALAQDIGAFVSLYDSETPDVKTQAVQQWPVRGRDLLGRLSSSQTLQGQLLAAAKANYARSQTIKRQGQDLIPQIATLTAAENFSQARTVLNQVSANYSQSLALQEDPAFRTDSDAQVKDLFDQILKAENVVVVRDVRNLITQGSQAYLAQQFTQAEQVLLRARNRWATTNTDPNSEVEYWLTLANYALSVTTGRQLSPIDPLYNEVQQLLNFARKDFTEGEDQLTAGGKESGMDLMKQAKDILSKILLPFPLNQEARLLNLQILKASDPENFPALFKQNFDAAVGKISNGDPTVAYNDLQDLQKIQPDYPGMPEAIKQVRIKLNLERPPVDPRVLAQAKALVVQAGRLIDGGSPAQLVAAQTQIRQALQLDPTNTDAQVLFDKVTLLLKPTVLTLTPTQVGEFTAILTLLQDQRTLEAQSQLTAFLAKYPGIANETRVTELIRRLARLNQ